MLATGAHDRPIVFADNDRPGIMLATAVRTYLNRYGVAAGDSIAVATTNDSAYELVSDLHAAGIDIPAVIDSRTTASAAAKRVSEETAYDSSSAPPSAAPQVRARRDGSVRSRSPVSTRTVSQRTMVRTSPSICSPSAADTHRSSTSTASARARSTGEPTSPPSSRRPPCRTSSRQAINGDYSLEAALRQGAEAGNAAADRTGFPIELNVPAAAPMACAPARPLWLVTSAKDEHTALTTHFIDFQRDQTVADVQRAMNAGMRSVEHIKRYTSISTANDQGKTSAVNAIGAIASVLGEAADLGQVGHTTFRAPFAPVPFAALAGRRKGELFDPARITSIHSWHVAHGAEFEDVGQWKRPWYYPKPGEDMDAAVLREGKAVRESVGFQDASTLGKIEIRGAGCRRVPRSDLHEWVQELKVGKGRYGLMCKPDGMIFDDGVTLRVAEDRYYMTTTTGGAATVLEWLERNGTRPNGPTSTSSSPR